MARRLGALLTACFLVALAAPVPASAAAPSVRPKEDPFYRYVGSTPLAALAPGTVLAHRAVTLAVDVNSTPLAATQLLYRTSDEQGRPSATVTTVVAPPGSTVNPRLVGYLSFYDSLSDKCDPSYTLTGGNPGANNTQLTDAEQAFVAQHYVAGYVVTVPDFEGTGLHWTAGHEAAYGSLDAARATISYLGLAPSTPVGFTGYSGGSIAGEWAAELAPTYAPHLNIVGVALGGLPVHFAHNLHYIEGSQSWSGIIPAVILALARAYRLDLAPYLSAKGRTLTTADQDGCIGDFSGTTPGLTSNELLLPQYQPITSIKPFVSIVNKLIMGSAPGHPQVPMLMEVGNDPHNSGAGPNDTGQGDDIMITADVQQLAYEYCQQGVHVEFHVLSNLSHTNAGAAFEPQADAFLAARFAGAPFIDTCSTLTPGNDISPIAVSAPAHPATVTSTTRRSSGGAKPGVGGTGDGLADTGMPTALAVVAVGLLASVGLLRRIRPARG